MLVSKFKKYNNTIQEMIKLAMCARSYSYIDPFRVNTSLQPLFFCFSDSESARFFENQTCKPAHIFRVRGFDDKTSCVLACQRPHEMQKPPNDILHTIF
jgi:hypothetical protein